MDEYTACSPALPGKLWLSGMSISGCTRLIFPLKTVGFPKTIYSVSVFILSLIHLIPFKKTSSRVPRGIGKQHYQPLFAGTGPYDLHAPDHSPDLNVGQFGINLVYGIKTGPVNVAGKENVEQDRRTLPIFNSFPVLWHVWDLPGQKLYVCIPDGNHSIQQDILRIFAV